MVVAHHLGGVTRKHKAPKDSLEEWGLLPVPALFLVVPSHSEKKGSRWPHTHYAVKDGPELLILLPLPAECWDVRLHHV